MTQYRYRQAFSKMAPGTLAGRALSASPVASRRAELPKRPSRELLLDIIGAGYLNDGSPWFQPGNITVDNSDGRYNFIAIAIAGNQGPPTVTPPVGSGILLDRLTTEHASAERQFMQLIIDPPATVLTWTISTPRAVVGWGWAGRGIVGDIGAANHGYNADPAPVWLSVTVPPHHIPLGLVTWHGNNSGLDRPVGWAPIHGDRDATPLTSGPTGYGGNFAGGLNPIGLELFPVSDDVGFPPGPTGDLDGTGLSFDSLGNFTTGDHGNPWSTALFTIGLTVAH